MAFITYFTVLFFIAMLAILKTRKSKSSDVSGFMLGGRSVNFWLTAISAHASDMSDWLFMAYPAMIFIDGTPAVWIAIGLVSYMFLNWHFIAPKLRIETDKYKSSTLSSYFEQRFSDHSGSIRIFSAIVAIVFFTLYIAAGFRGIGLLFEFAFDSSFVIGVSIAILVVMTYTALGGYIAVAWTDFFQGMFLLVMITLVPLVAFGHINGFSAIKLATLSRNISLGLFSDYSLGTILSSLLTAFGWGLGYFGMPHILTKFMGIKDPSEINKSKYLGITWQVLSLTAATFVGLIGIAFFKNGLLEPETIFVDMVKTLFNPFFGGFILCGIFAATISTIDSQVLVLASTITEDLYKGLFRRKAKEQELLWVYRIGITTVCFIAAYISMDRALSITKLVYYAWRGLGSTFAPAVLLALYSKRVNRYGILFGMIAGCSTVIFCAFFLTVKIDSMIPAFVLNFIVAWIVSYSTKSLV